MSNIKEKIEMELKPYETMCEQTTEHLKMLITGSQEAGADEILTVAKALGEIIDIKKDIVEMCYKKQIMAAMEESEYDTDYDENGPKYYGGRRRSARTGRFIRGYEEKVMNPDRDMDRMNEGRMYYTDSSNTHVVNPVTRPYTDTITPSITNMKDNGRFSNSRRMYMETKENKPGDKAEHQNKLSVSMDDLSTDIKEMWAKMGNEEKTIAKTKLQNLVNTL